MSRDAAILLEEGLRVLTAQIAQEDPQRGWRVICGLALNARRSGAVTYATPRTRAMMSGDSQEASVT